VRDPSAFLESTPLVPIELDGNGNVLYVGAQARDLLGLPLEAWAREGFWADRVLPDDQAALADVRENTLAARGRHSVDMRMERANGRVVWVCELLSFAEVDGEPRLRGFLWDVTDRKQQELTLWRREERVRALVRSAPDAMVLTDRTGSVLNMNDQAESLFGYRLDDIIGSSIDLLVPERFRPRMKQLRRVFERDPERRSVVEGQAFTVERGDGDAVPVELSLSLVSSDDHERRILWSLRDLTVRRRAASEARARPSHPGAEEDDAMTCTLDRLWRYRYVSGAYARFHGWLPHQLEGRSLREVVGERAFARLGGAFDRVREGGAASVRADLANADGETASMQVSLVPHHDDDGEVTGCTLLMVTIPSLPV